MHMPSTTSLQELESLLTPEPLNSVLNSRELWHSLTYFCQWCGCAVSTHLPPKEGLPSSTMLAGLTAQRPYDLSCLLPGP